jgi:hypothetical protein
MMAVLRSTGARDCSAVAAAAGESAVAHEAMPPIQAALTRTATAKILHVDAIGLFIFFSSVIEKGISRFRHGYVRVATTLFELFTGLQDGGIKAIQVQFDHAACGETGRVAVDGFFHVPDEHHFQESYEQAERSVIP